MGADMCGYIIKGPKKLPKKAFSLAVKALMKQRQESFQGVFECPVCGETVTDEKCDGYCGWPLVNSKTTDERIKEIARSLVDEWPPESRDCASRQDPDNPKQIIVFAGDMSWGDEPEGTGYIYIKSLTNSGVDKAWGIR